MRTSTALKIIAKHLKENNAQLTINGVNIIKERAIIAVNRYNSNVRINKIRNRVLNNR